MEKFKERLRIARWEFERDRKCSVKKLSDKTMEQHYYIGKILSSFGKPSMQTIRKISLLYDVSADWLLGLSSKKKIDRGKKECPHIIKVWHEGDFIVRSCEMCNAELKREKL